MWIGKQQHKLNVKHPTFLLCRREHVVFLCDHIKAILLDSFYWVLRSSFPYWHLYYVYIGYTNVGSSKFSALYALIVYRYTLYYGIYLWPDITTQLSEVTVLLVIRFYDRLSRNLWANMLQKIGWMVILSLRMPIFSSV